LTPEAVAQRRFQMLVRSICQRTFGNWRRIASASHQVTVAGSPFKRPVAAARLTPLQ